MNSGTFSPVPRGLISRVATARNHVCQNRPRRGRVEARDEPTRPTAGRTEGTTGGSKGPQQNRARVPTTVRGPGRGRARTLSRSWRALGKSVVSSRIIGAGLGSLWGGGRAVGRYPPESSGSSGPRITRGGGSRRVPAKIPKSDTFRTNSAGVSID